MRPERLAAANSVFAVSWRAAAVISLVLLFSPGKFARAQTNASQIARDPTYDAQSFIQLLGRLKTELDSVRESTEKIRAYRESLPQVWAVNAGGRHFDVPTALLASRLLKAEKQPESRVQELDQARAYLDALAAETASGSSSQASVNTDSARAKLNAILARSEYTHKREQSWWDQLRERMNEIFFNVLRRLLRGVGGQKSLANFLLWIGVCAAAIVIAYWTFRHWFRAATVKEMALQAASVRARSWQEWVYAARESAERGDYRGAIHCAYWAGIARLQELGALAPDRAKTPREYLGALSKSRVLQPETFVIRKQALSALTTRLEVVWYGYRAATEADFRDSLTQLETLGCRLP